GGRSLWEGGSRAGREESPPPCWGRDKATPVGRSCHRSVVSSSAGDYSADRAGVSLPRVVGRWERGRVCGFHSVSLLGAPRAVYVWACHEPHGSATRNRKH